MNKINKVVISILGACNIVMSIFMPITIALLLLALGGASVNKLNSIMILIVALGASTFRAIKPWLN